MKKFMGWMLVLSLGMFIVGCGDEKKDTKKPEPAKTGGDTKAPEGEKK